MWTQRYIALDKTELSIMIKKKYSIYLADDDDDDRDFFEEVVEQISSRITLRTFGNGIDLINGLNTTTKVPDCIFLDLDMPLMDGEECLHAIRNSRRLKKIPVVIYSTSIDITNAERLRDLGANLYLKKPNTFNGLKIAISNCLEHVKENPISRDNGTGFIVQL